jgi:hypothetical protein
MTFLFQFDEFDQELVKIYLNVEFVSKFLEHRRSWNGLLGNVATQPVSWPVTLDRLGQGILATTDI